MKTPLFILPLLLAACSEQAVTHPPIVQVRPMPDAQVSLKTSVPDSLVVEFDSLAGHVARYNPSLAGARLLIAEAQGRLRGSGIRSNTELELEFETDSHFRDLMLTVGVSRKFPRTNRLAIEQRVSAILVEAARAEVEDVQRVIVGEARSAYVEILALREHRGLLSAQEANARKLADFIQESALRGESSILEAGTASLEATRLGNQASRMQIKEQMALAKLKPLLGMPPGGTLAVKGALSKPAMPPMNVSNYHRPDLKAARLRAQSAIATTDLERSKAYDDYEAGIFAGVGREEDNPKGLDDEQIIGVRFKIPWGENYAQRGVVDAARARSSRLAIGAEALKRRINAQSHAAYAEMKQWQQLSTQIESEFLPIAEAQIAKTKEAYEKGELALQDVLRAEDQKLALATAQLEARRDFHLARVNYLTSTAQ